MPGAGPSARSMSSLHRLGQGGLRRPHPTGYVTCRGQEAFLQLPTLSPSRPHSFLERPWRPKPAGPSRGQSPLASSDPGAEDIREGPGGGQVGT